MKSVDEIKRIIEFEENNIQVDLSFYYELIESNERRWKKLADKWSTPKEYVDVLYWMRFVKEYNPSEIITVTDFTEFPKHYMYLGWKFDGRTIADYEKERNELKQRLLEIKDGYSEDSNIFDSDDFKRKALASYGKHSEKAMQHLRKYAQSEEELVKRFYYYLYEKNLTNYEISVMYDASTRAIQNIIEGIGFPVDLSEVQKKAAQKRNYTAVVSNGKKTRLSTLEFQGVYGSQTENLIRTGLEQELARVLSNKYEIVVGISTNTIVPPREIDIPIIIINKNSQEIYKFAVEVNGSYWHKDTVDKDKEKCEKAEKNLWKYIGVYIDYGTGNNKNAGRLLDDIKEIATKIIYIINDIKSN